MDKPNTAPSWLGRNHSPDKPNDAHGKRSESVDTVNKSPNKALIIFEDNVRWELASLFNHHPRILGTHHFNKDPYREFGIFTKELQTINPQLYDTLCGEYHDMIVNNNKITDHWSLIVRSHKELLDSDDIVMILFQDRLVAAVRTQMQDWDGEKNGIYQRWSLLVLPEFRGMLDTVNLSHLLITTINQRNAWKPTYSVVQTDNKSTIKSNEASWFEYMLVKDLSNSMPKVYKEIVQARGWEDFRDLKTWETPDDYSITFNALAKKKFRQFDNVDVTPIHDALLGLYENDTHQGDAVWVISN